MKVIAFDVDDTLVKEREFCLSGFKAVAELVEDVLDTEEVVYVMSEALAERRNHYDALERLAAERGVSLDMKGVVATCRNHIPTFKPRDIDKAVRWIKEVRERGDIPAIITDGRSLTQRNKLKALDLTGLIAPSDILISEETGADKKSPLMFRRLMELHPDAEGYVYVGDNVEKDFYWPRRLGWYTVGISDPDRLNIHPRPANVSPGYEPHEWI